MMGQMGAGMDRVFAVLTPEQRQSLREGAERNREEVRLLEEKLRAARKAAMEAGIEPNFDEAELRQKLRVVADLDADLTVLRAHALANVEPPLSAEQIEKLKNPAPLGEMQRDRRPDALQPRPPGNFPPREPLPQGDRPIRRGPPEGQRPPPDQF